VYNHIVIFPLFMRRIILYIVIVLLLFSGIQEIKSIWEENEKDLDDTYAQVKEGLSGWFQTATETSKELKEQLNEKISTASEQYEKIKADIEATTAKINEKRDQLDKTLKEMEEAKKALDELLEKEAAAENTESLESESES